MVSPWVFISHSSLFMLCISLYFCLCLPWLSIGKYHIFLSCLPFMALFVCEISLLISPRLSTFLSLGQWWWLVVSILAFYPYNHSSKPAEAYSLLCKNVFEKKENYQTEARCWPTKSLFFFQSCLLLSLSTYQSISKCLPNTFLFLSLSVNLLLKKFVGHFGRICSKTFCPL